MKIRRIHHAVAAVACLGLMLPHGALAAPATLTAKQGDIALRDGGLLVGQVVDAQGKALKKAAVSVRQGNAEIVRTVTDKNGVFAAKGLRGGEYQVVTSAGQVNYRLWAPNTAPPAAAKGALIVSDGRSSTASTAVAASSAGSVSTRWRLPLVSRPRSRSPSPLPTTTTRRAEATDAQQELNSDSSPADHPAGLLFSRLAAIATIPPPVGALPLGRP